MLSKNNDFLEDWLSEFKSKNTRKVYRSGIHKFENIIGIEDLEKYVKDSPDVASDMRKLLASLEGCPPKTVQTYSGAVKVFLQDKGVKVSDESWKKIRRRGYLPKRTIPQTQDKRPTKQQLKRILNYVDIKGKALILFLLSSGGRIGETRQLKEEDLELDAEPPRVHFRGETTKGGVGERTAYFSYEARDAIKDWLAIKNSMGKRDGKTYESDNIFHFSHNTANNLWGRACDKAKLGVKDKRTNRRVYHLHTLRKFFRTKIGIELDMIHSLLGHSEYLDQSYLRLNQQEIAEAYLEAMPNVSVYDTVDNQELMQKADTIEEENRILKEKLAKMEEKMAQLNADQKLVREFIEGLKAANGNNK